MATIDGLRRLALAGSAALALGAGPARARVLTLDLHRVPGLAFGGASFGATGTYEKWEGRATGAVDPADPVDGAIADIGLAPRDARGLVEYSTPVVLLRPSDPARGRHELLMDLNNRGGVLGFAALDDAPAEQNDVGRPADIGDGFLMGRGYTLAWSGWDPVSAAAPAVGAGPGAFLLDVPVARRPDGSAVTGPSMDEFVVDDDRTASEPLTYPAADRDTARATLTVRALAEDAPVALPPTAWRFDPGGTAIGLLPEGTRFRAGEIYELTYPAKDPKVAGLGFAALRDVLAYLRGAASDDAGHPNPLAGDVRTVTTFCVSQPCRMMRDFVRLGFNAAPGGGRAVDGVLDWVGGGSGIDLDRRFAEPFRTHRQHIARHYPEFAFPFAYNTTTDAVTGRTDGLLARCAATATCPKIIDANSDNEYWAKSGSNLHTDAAGQDLPDLPDVRLYLLASLPHGGGVPLHGKGICRVERNPLVADAVLRALLVDLDAWVADGVPPPPNRIPRAAEGTLVAADRADTGFPSIPGVPYGRAHAGDLLDFGPDAARGIFATLPPAERRAAYPTLVPKVDADGNTLPGVRVPAVAVPTATYTGWNTRADDDGDGCDHAGMVVPFARTEAERRAAGDPRPSLEARYPSHADYVARVAAAAERLVEDRFLLLDDAVREVAEAQASAVGR